MPRILDYTGREAVRTVTVADIVGLKVSGRRLAQVTASTSVEATAAETAGIEMVVCLSDFVPAVRAGSWRQRFQAARASSRAAPRGPSPARRRPCPSR